MLAIFRCWVVVSKRAISSRYRLFLLFFTKHFLNPHSWCKLTIIDHLSVFLMMAQTRFYSIFQHSNYVGIWILIICDWMTTGVLKQVIFFWGSRSQMPNSVIIPNENICKSCLLKNLAQSLDLCQQEEVIHMEDWEPPPCVCIYAATFNPFGIINLGVIPTRDEKE